MSSNSSSAHRAGYSRTRWSRVIALRQPEPDAARRSLEELSGRFWYPVYAFTRASGHAAADAAELTARFFEQLPARVIAEDPRGQGRFRDFLRTTLGLFLAGAPTRAPPASPARLEPPQPLAELERRLAEEHPTDGTPEDTFHRSFALEILRRSLERLEREAADGHRTRLFEALRPFLGADPPASGQAALAQQLAMPPLAISIALKRLRQRFRELVDEEMMETVESPSDLDQERTSLLALLSGRPA